MMIFDLSGFFVYWQINLGRLFKAKLSFKNNSNETIYPIAG